MHENKTATNFKSDFNPLYDPPTFLISLTYQKFRFSLLCLSSVKPGQELCRKVDIQMKTKGVKHPRSAHVFPDFLCKLITLCILLWTRCTMYSCGKNKCNWENKHLFLEFRLNNRFLSERKWKHENNSRFKFVSIH